MTYLDIQLKLKNIGIQCMNYLIYKTSCLRLIFNKILNINKRIKDNIILN